MDITLTSHNILCLLPATLDELRQAFGISVHIKGIEDDLIAILLRLSPIQLTKKEAKLEKRLQQILKTLMNKQHICLDEGKYRIVLVKHEQETV